MDYQQTPDEGLKWLIENDIEKRAYHKMMLDAINDDLKLMKAEQKRRKKEKQASTPPVRGRKDE